ncbi:MAG TPA: gephyrin-like molybdotransferase Glp, partial [Candidatus Saccharimonadales bacterium]|nr:gephyrin-like molybdotransferase Glp [Candidatus Saccharimonadales bacterium]
MIELKEAQRILLAGVRLLPEEVISLSRSAGRILAADLLAPSSLPPFDNSAMDGFALRAQDTSQASQINPVKLKVLGRMPAGAGAGPTLQPQTCVRVFTGSLLPVGTTGVIMQEDASFDQETSAITVTEIVRPWENLRLCGEDVKQGEPLLNMGERLNPQRMALAAAVGLHELSVRKRPTIGVIATGNELAEAGTELPPGSIFESNRVAIGGALELAGAIARIYPIVSDDLAATQEALRKAFDECDAVISSGGVSVGDHDYVKTAFEEIGGKLQFWKVAIKPGKPFVFGEFGDKQFFGLPGNPVSAFVTFFLLVSPVISKLQGAIDLLP